ncbi:hypothetical protein [Pontibacter anaerobius]|uniref:Energy-coupling factor transport system substrate-specific component n=1 Tax=Pontibacter anaerobius TaxID=2993940 RepID=A0ABT3RB55_9BACT|nr:hypothetical protein [Pontibacter anaerobius]MCX2738663.1 hypothetical protein [Pontibacter anaerobius]
MGVTADIKRVLLTTVACFLLTAIAFRVNNQDQVPLISPFLFTLVIVLANLDQVRVNKLKAIGLGLMLTLPVFLVSVLAGVGLTQMLKGAQAGMVISSAMSGALMFLVNSLFFNMRSFKAGLAITAVLGAIAPFVARFVELYLPGINSSAGFIEDPGLFFICWQTLVGLGISIGIWVGVDQKKLK